MDKFQWLIAAGALAFAQGVMGQTGPCASSAQDRAERAYAQGSCYVEQQDYRAAIPILEALVRSDAWPVYQAELGRAYLGAQRFEAAREAFRAALAGDPTEQARAVLLVYLRLAEEEQTQARTWFGSANLGLVYDSNVNSGPASSAVTLYGLPFTMNEDAMPKSDWGLRTQLSLVHAQPVSSMFSWQSQVNAEVLTYQHEKAYETYQLMAESGPRANFDQGRVGIYAPVGVSGAWLGGRAYQQSFNVTPQLRYAWGSAALATVGVLGQKSRFNDATAMNSGSLGGFVSWRQTLWGSWTLEGGARFTTEHAEDPAYSNRRLGGTIALRGVLPWGLRAGGELGLTRAWYRAAESWADEARRDVRRHFQVSVSRDLGHGFYATLSWQRWRSLSNLGLYENDRDQVQLSVSRAF